MLSHTARVCGLALALGALALTPLVARADTIIAVSEEYIDRPCEVAGVIRAFPDKDVDHQSATVLILSECAIDAHTPRDEPETGNQVGQEDPEPSAKPAAVQTSAYGPSVSAHREDQLGLIGASPLSNAFRILMTEGRAPYAESVEPSSSTGFPNGVESEPWLGVSGPLSHTDSRHQE